MANADTTNNEILERTIGATVFQDRVYRRFLAAAISATTESVQATTSAQTASANATLTFAAQPVGIAVGWSVQSLTNPAAIPATALVKTLGAAVVMSIATTAIVASGDIIVFSPPSHAQRLAFASALFSNAVNRQMLVMLILANPTNSTDCLADPNAVGGNITDSNIDFQVSSVFTGIATSRGW